MIDPTHGAMAEKTIIAVGEMRMGAMADVDVKLNLFLFTMLCEDIEGQHLRRLPGHDRRQEHPRRHQVHRIGLVDRSLPLGA